MSEPSQSPVSPHPVSQVPQPEAGSDGIGFRAPRREDRADLVRLFNCSYGIDEETKAAQRRTESHWRWKYEQNPAGADSTVAYSMTDGRLVGHIGGIPYVTWHRGRVRRAVQTCDHMIHPETRRGLRRVGLFAKLMNSWIQAYGHAHHDFVGWGFPSNQNFRIGQKFCGYTLFRTLNILIKQTPAIGGFSGVRARRASRFVPEVDDLWIRSRDQFPLAGIRNEAYLSWRYTHHPEWRYEILEARDATDDRLRGLAIVRLGGLAPDVVSIMEWIVPHGDEDATRCLLKEATQFAEESERSTLTAWFPESSRLFNSFQEEGFRVRFTSTLLAGRSFDAQLSVREIRQNYFMSFGDLDYL